MVFTKFFTSIGQGRQVYCQLTYTGLLLLFWGVAAQLGKVSNFSIDLWHGLLVYLWSKLYAFIPWGLHFLFSPPIPPNLDTCHMLFSPEATMPLALAPTCLGRQGGQWSVSNYSHQLGKVGMFTDGRPAYPYRFLNFFRVLLLNQARSQLPALILARLAGSHVVETLCIYFWASTLSVFTAYPGQSRYVPCIAGGPPCWESSPVCPFFLGLP